MKNSKKLLSLLLAVAMLASVFTVMASAYTYTGTVVAGNINVKYTVEKVDSVPANDATGSAEWVADNIYAVTVWAQCDSALTTLTAPLHYNKAHFSPITLSDGECTYPLGAGLDQDTYYTDMGEGSVYAYSLGDYMNNTGMFKADGSTAASKALAKCIGLGNANSAGIDIITELVSPDHTLYSKWGAGLPANTGVLYVNIDVAGKTKTAYLNTISGIETSRDWNRMFTFYFETLPGVTEEDVIGDEFGVYTADCFTVDGATDDAGYGYFVNATTTIVGNPTKNVVENATIVETSILNPLKNQIKFGVNEEGASDGTFDYRMLAVITGADFTATFTDVDTAKGMITEMGFVHAISDDGSVIDMATARGVVNGTAANGYTLTKVNYLSTSISSGNYVMSLFIDNIPAADKGNTVSAIAYIKTADAIYFYPVVASAQFSGLYDTYYSQAFPA